MGAIITPQKDASFLVEGNLRVFRADGTLAREAERVYLCRCGHSRDKPFCDGTHKLVGWRNDGGIVLDKMKPDDEPPADDVVEFRPKPDGSLKVKGFVEVRGLDGKVCVGTKCSLCRCGASLAQPFCDDAHKAIGFKDPEPDSSGA